MEKDLSFHMGKITLGDVKRQFLTIEELNRLARTDCNFMMLKEAALFSALTGLRYSDIEKLTWGEIEYLEGMGNVLSFRQRKTLKVENLPISDQALEILGTRGKPDQRVFPTLKYSCQISKSIRSWAEAAGVKKKLTFHCFRHTFATLQFSQGTDIYTVSKLLGHRELKTTQVYVKIMDVTKRTAVDKLKLDIPLKTGKGKGKKT
jgi:integrase